jgi:hypothetical protein
MDFYFMTVYETGCCEYGNEPSGFIKSREKLDQLSLQSMELVYILCKYCHVSVSFILNSLKARITYEPKYIFGLINLGEKLRRVEVKRIDNICVVRIIKYFHKTKHADFRKLTDTVSPSFV